MAMATSLLAASSASQGVASFGNAYVQSKALQAQAEFERQEAEMNARVADLQAEDATRRGAAEANRARKEGRQVISAQRAASAAQGIDINTGSAGDIQEETLALSEQDVETIKSNAWREAWGFKAQALDLRSGARLQYHAKQSAARNTLLTGGINALGQFATASTYAAKGIEDRRGTSASKSAIPDEDELKMPEFGSSLKRKPKYSLY
jgi:hypothetical protein